MKLGTKIFIAVLLILAIYLNRSYAFIYSKFELTSPPAEKNYMTQLTFSEKSKIWNYVAIGDSLTAGAGASAVKQSLPAQLAEKISVEDGVPVNVINLGMPGATSFDILGNKLADVSTYNPDLITVFIGTNDIHNFVPIDQFKKNLNQTILDLKASSKAKIYLIELPYIGANDLILPPYDLYFKLQIQRYNQALAEVAKLNDVKLIELYDGSKLKLNSESDMYSLDRFHPSDKGYELWANLIYDQLK